ncbi:MAG TPA: histidine phosphatase family protein [Thermoanaerobaculia bacterium]|nr:histidine phosphatase family protein [Thermoanaerobaculia bacterium]
MIEQLILVRHGETLHNANGIAQGSQDSALSDLGRDQVARLARRLVSHRPEALYSSPLPRALTTAEAIREVTGLDIQVLDDLREMNYGGWEGRSFLDVRRKEEEHYQRWIADPAFPCPGGESHNDVLERMGRAFDRVRAARRPVLVTHGTAIRIGATLLLGAPVSTARHLAQDNASFNLFVWRADRCVLKVWNDTSHCGRDEG